jgi:hydrogenase maturation protease
MIALQLIGETPPEVVVLGVQPQSTGWSASLTPPVADALGALIDFAISELERWSS